MATSITQAKPLLTAAELELFDHSRAQPIKALTAKQIASKEKRVRALRDKYRDLYRRQTVAQRGNVSKGTAGDDVNARTQRKAEIMQEVLDRFEARSTQLEAREEREPAQVAPAKPSKKSVTAAAKTKAAPATSKKSASGASTPKPAAKQAAGKTPLAKASRAKVVAKSAPMAPAGTAPARARKPKDTEHAISAVAHLHDGAEAAHMDHLTGKDPTPRSIKAPSDRAPSHGGKAQAPDLNAPLDMVASAKRGNPVRNMPGNIAIQGHQSSAVRRAQGKRDSR